MTQTLVVATAPGTVSSIKKYGDKWVIIVTSAAGYVVYSNIDIPAVASCQQVNIGQPIGYNNVVQTVVNIGMQMYKYRGNGTMVHTDSRLVGATNVMWSRAGILKDDADSGATTDYYEHDAVAGTITTPEAQETTEWFHVWYTPKP